MAECPNQDFSELRIVLVFLRYKFSFLPLNIYIYIFSPPYLVTWYCTCLLCILESSHSLSTHQLKQIPADMTIICYSVLSSVHLQMKWMYCSEIKLQEFRFSAWCFASLRSQVQSVSILLFQRERCFVTPLFRWNQITLQLLCNCLSLCNWKPFKLCWMEGERDNNKSLLGKHTEYKNVIKFIESWFTSLTWSRFLPSSLIAW